ncbi:MAG: TIGR00282 family metallophosphoesterase [Verrucomicrobiales bacterium]|nr:TIGR00282 family metallophosphoesterase [Verrucomicrobiales bacterium]
MALTPLNATESPGQPLRILFLGDVFGEPGRRAVIDLLPKLKERHQIDFVIVNGENSAGGRGITPKICIALLRAGAAVVTLGDHAWDQQEIIDYMETEPRLLRPVNYPPGTPGQGAVVLETDKGKVAVLNAQGRTFTNPPLENPFLACDREVDALRQETPVIFVDFHAEATSEKIAMGRALDGRVSAVVGTHTHVQTADETIFPGGTAFLCDAGMCGPVESIIGSRIEPVLQRFRTSMPGKFLVGGGPSIVCGVWVEVDSATGRARHIERVREMWTTP